MPLVPWGWGGGKAQGLHGTEREYPLGWKGSPTEVTGVNQVVEDSEGVGGPELAAWPGLGWAPDTRLPWPS